MNVRTQATLLWVLAIIITLTSVVYQRRTGPTYPVRGEVEHNGAVLRYELPRSEDTGVDAEIVIEGDVRGVGASFEWRRFRSNDNWQSKPFEPNLSNLSTTLPTQPAAGKVMYKILVRFQDGHIVELTEEPTIIRFKGSVPLAVLIPHILFMFISMLLSTRTGLAAWVRSDATIRYAWITFVLLILGGMILGPLVQKFAFDAFWTGWPFGQDLTDNKTLAAVLGWGLAFWRYYRKGEARGWFIAAAIIQLLVYLIPHSLLGSELDYTTME